MSQTKRKTATRRRRPQHSDEALLRAACAVFARDGYAAATVDAIAAEAGTTKPTLYARFGSKRDLYEAAATSESAALRRHLFTAYDQATGGSLEDFVAAAVGAWFAFAAERPDGMRLLFVADHVGTESEAGRATSEAIIDRLAVIADEFTRRRGGGAAGPAGPVIGALTVGAAVYAIRRCLADPALDPPAVAALTTNYLSGAVRGLDPALFAVRRGGAAQGRGR